MDLQISVRKLDDVTIVDLHGIATIEGGSELLSSCLGKLVASGVRKLLLNLADLTKIDSSGLSVMVTTCSSLRGQGGEMKFLHPRGRVLEVFRIMRLSRIMHNFDDESQALASFRSQQDYAARP